MRSSGSASSDDPLRGGDGLALVHERAHDRAQVGPLADAPVRESRQRADGIRRSVEDDLAPLRRSRVGDGRRRHPAARARVREPRDLVRAGRLRLERAERRLALHVPLHDAGLEDLPGRERRSADDARDVCGDDLLVAHTVLHGRDRTVCERVCRGRDRPSVCIAFVATIPKSHSGSSAASVVARGRPSTSPAPVSLRPFALIASTCARETS